MFTDTGEQLLLAQQVVRPGSGQISGKPELEAQG